MIQKFCSALFCALMLSSCASAPKRDEQAITLLDAKRWLKNHCSKGSRELEGSLVFQAKTREFKGQHPGSLVAHRDGSFFLEVTHLLGGTLMRFKSDGKTFAVEVPSRPKVNRSGERQYLGIELPMLSQLLLGDLPCPQGWEHAPIETRGAAILLKAGPWQFEYSRAREGEEMIPWGLDLVPVSNEGSSGPIQLRFQDWSAEEKFSKKVKISSPEGELKWIWRSRSAMLESQ